MNKRPQSQFRICPCCNPAIDLLAQTFLSRRQFMLLGTGVFAATVALSGQSQATPKPDSTLISRKSAIADKIYLNANVVTVNDAQPKLLISRAKRWCPDLLTPTDIYSFKASQQQ
jgi:hypothetical protein